MSALPSCIDYYIVSTPGCYLLSAAHTAHFFCHSKTLKPRTDSKLAAVSMERADNTETGLEQKVRHWLEVSGKKSELQAKLRAELYGAIQTEIAFRGDINITGEVERRAVSHREKIINWLVSQHLTTNRHWLTNSVFVRY